MASAITPRGQALLRKPPSVSPAADEVYYEAGGSTFHVHTCTHADGSHLWKCNSPYCASLIGSCPDHGGEEPFHIGREPWKR
jgi:hypothetical protein